MNSSQMQQRRQEPAPISALVRQGAGYAILAGIVLGGIWWAVGKYRQTIVEWKPVLSPYVEWLRQWALLIGIALVVLGILTLFLMRGRRPGKDQMRLEQVAGQSLRVRPDQLTARAKWSGRGDRRRPTKVRFTYPPGSIDQSRVDQLGEALSSAWQTYYQMRWDDRHDAIDAIESTRPEQAPDSELAPAATDPLERTRQIAVAHFGPSTIVQATAVDEAGEPTAISIQYPPSPKASSELLRTRIGEEVTLRLPGGGRAWTAKWDLERDTLHVRHRPPLPTHVLHPILDADPSWPAKGLVLPYATDGYGAAIGWNLNASTPHALVVGPTGTGKTVCLRSIALEAVTKGCEVWIGDPKRVEMKGLRGWPGVVRLNTKIPDIIEMVTDAHSLMMARYEAIENNQVLRTDLTPLVVILDEHLIFWAAANRHWKMTKEKGQTGSTHPVLDLLLDLIVLARTSRIHLCFGVQRPDAALFDKGGRDSIRHRISLGVLSPEGAMMMWNNARIGTEVDMSVAGRATAVGSDGTADDVQTWWTPDPDPYLLERDPDALSSDELAALAALRGKADAAQSARGLDDLAHLRPTAEPEDEHSDQDEHDVPADVTTAERAKNLEAGMAVLVELDGTDVRGVIVDVDIDDTQDEVTIEFTTSNGPEVLTVEADEVIMVIQSPTVEAA